MSTRADNSTRSATDVLFKTTGVGHLVSAKCSARKGYFLCGQAISVKGYCRECSEARAARAGRAA